MQLMKQQLFVSKLIVQPELQGPPQHPYSNKVVESCISSAISIRIPSERQKQARQV